MPDAPGAPDRATIAALAAQVADLRSKVVTMEARLRMAGLDGSINLPGKLSELAGMVADGAREDGRGHAAPYWLDYEDTEYAAKLAELADWVDTVLLANYQVPGLRPCWPHHMQAVWEISTLAAEWARIYERKQPDLAAALIWHDRWLPGVIRRLQPVMKDCTDTKCGRTSPR